MKQINPALCRHSALAIVAITSGLVLGQNKADSGTTTDIPGTQPNIHLVAPVANGQWTMPAGDYGNTRYSPLNQINTTNIHNLHVVGEVSTGVLHGHEGSPLVVGDTLYIVTPFPDKLMAVDLTRPGLPVKWTFNPNPDNRAVGIACCDVVNRGASYADGNVIYNTLDDHTVAVDANTGKLAWETQVGDVNKGETMTMAPVVVNNIVLVGNSGGELGARDKLVALNAHSGKILWTAYSTGPDSDVRIGPDFHPYYAKDRGADLGVSTWNPDQLLALQDGRTLFNWYNCSGCHGEHGGGGMGPSLRDPIWFFGNRDDQIFDSIAHGRSNGMPAWGTKLPPKQIWEPVTYIKSLGTPQEPDPPQEPADETEANPQHYESTNPGTPIFIAGSTK